VIEIIDKKDSYPTLLGINWVFNDNVISNLSSRKMSYEKNNLRVVSLLDLTEGNRFTQPTNDNIQC
jgi:hypothetical protein